MTTGVSPYSLKSIEELRCKAAAGLAAITDANDAEKFRIAWLGKKGLIREMFKGISEVSAPDRKAFGEKINALRAFLESGLQKLLDPASGGEASEQVIDGTLPGFPFPRGSLRSLRLSPL